MKKFWNKAESSDDIYIYGDIASDSDDETSTTAKMFVEDLKACKGGVNLHINSGGGDVFQALAICNALKSYKGNVNIIIDGLCASAATLIICAGHKVSMASNALLMVHTPSVGLLGYYDAAELSKIESSLIAVEGAILDTYKGKLPKKNHMEIARMMTAETWLTAEEAQEIGFVDEITGGVEMEVNAAKNLLFVNKVKFDCKKLGEKFRAKINLQEVRKVEEKTVQVQDTLDVKQANDILIQDAIKQARAQELTRIKNLMTLRGENAAVNAIVDVAINEGAEVSDVKKYIDAVKSVKVETAKAENVALDAITAAIRDNMNSGAQNVSASLPILTAEDKRMENAKTLAEMANKLRGVKRG